MTLKSMILATAITFGAAVSSLAATLSNVEVVVGGPTITDTAAFTSTNGDAGATVTGGGAATGSTTTDALALQAEFQGLTNQFSVFSSGPDAPGLFLAGSFMDAQASDGEIEVLYGTDPLSGAFADFGSLFRLTIADSAITANALDFGASPLFFFGSALTVEAVTEITVPPIPLPASGLLLLAGAGALFGLRRRKAA